MAPTSLALRNFKRQSPRSCKWAAIFASAAAYIIYLIWFPQGAKFPAFTANSTERRFLLHGKPVQILSGAIHYFRVLPELWEDRLTTMRSAGLNAIETYVEWSSHEPEEGEFDFEGQQNLVGFLQLAHSMGFMVILRPGPYICAERDFGGLPYWLLRNGSSIRLRSSDENYLPFAKRFLTKVYQKVKPLLISNGGPIIMVQVENEYSQFGACDSKYMRSLRDLAWEELGQDVVLFTMDPDRAAKCGHVPGTLATVGFGTGVDPKHGFGKNLDNGTSGPLLNTELYTGWFDSWNKPHHTVNAKTLANSIRTILKMGASFNLYMFHGGTNFGFKSGANWVKDFHPQITSYDYDAPINEAGDATEKLKVIRDVIGEFFPDRAKRVIFPPKRKMALGNVTLKRVFGLKELRKLSSNRTVESPYPLTFEQLGQAYGFVLYETRITLEPGEPAQLIVKGIRDRGYVYLNDFHFFVGILSRTDNKFEVNLMEEQSPKSLSILVENQGRINFLDAMLDPKGIVSNVTLDGRRLTGWKMTPITLSGTSWIRDAVGIEKLRAGAAQYAGGLAVYAANFKLPQDQPVYDSFLRLDAWTKGVVFLNGFNLGRYWTRMVPQRTLYVPAPLFRKDENLLVVLELEDKRQHGPAKVEFVAEPFINASTHKSDQ
ncbi:beta-galactosidase-like [Haemaphysalis longicornis]